MNCPISGQPCNLAKNIHVTDITKDSIKTTDCCSICAPIDTISPQKSFFLEFMKKIIEKKKEYTALMASKLPCPGCGLTLLELSEKGRLGCGHCYIHFSSELKNVLMNSHGKIEHVGKVPKNWKKHEDQKSLKDQMKAAIATENYEEAARIKKLLESS